MIAPEEGYYTFDMKARAHTASSTRTEDAEESSFARDMQAKRNLQMKSRAHSMSAMRDPEECRHYDYGMYTRSRSVSTEFGSQHNYQQPQLLQTSSSTSSSMPRSALRVGKYDQTGRAQAQAQAYAERNRPLLNLGIIYEAYGEDATLYSVLGVKRSADQIDVRRAYLSRGRETLFSGGVNLSPDQSSPRNLDDVPEAARKKFQAVSVAYQILSNPQLRSDYDRWGVVYAPLGQTLEMKGRQSSVRWKPFVEERVISDAHPDEHIRRTRSSRGQQEGPSWLESHLKDFDKEAERFLKGDFFEGIDQSLTGSLTGWQESIGSFMRNVGSKESGTDKSASVEEDALVDGIANDVVPLALESNQNGKPGFVSKLRSKRNLFKKDAEIKVEPIQPNRGTSEGKGNSLTASPCSVLLCFEDETDTSVPACGLGMPFYL